MEEYISDNSVYARAKSNSMINPKMIGRVLGALLFIELGMFLLCGEPDESPGRVLRGNSFMVILYGFRDAAFLF